MSDSDSQALTIASRYLLTEHPTGGIWLCAGCLAELESGYICRGCHTVLCEDCSRLPHSGTDARGNAVPCPYSPLPQPEGQAA